MQLSEARYQFLQVYPMIEERILLLAIGHAQALMNLPEPTDTLKRERHAKLQAKAVELLNQPEGFKKRLTLSVVSMMYQGDLDSGVDDDALGVYVRDAFDGIAGVPPTA